MKYLSETCIPNHNYFNYKQPFLGSYKTMRYRVECLLPEEEDGEKLYLATTYPDTFCFEKTPEADKVQKTFPFHASGRFQVMEWLDEQYDKTYRKPDV